jgi:hypothetical protein
MAAHLSGPDNPNWKGGRTIASNGYVLIKAPWHPDADVRGYVYEHRLVAESKLKRRLRPGEEVHHDNEIKTDNRPENLIVTAGRAEHARHHRKRTDLRDPGEPNPQVACACGCGTTFPRYDATGRPRRYVSGHNQGLRSPAAPCACGCGRWTSPGKRYVRGHTSRIRPRPTVIITCACGCGATLAQYDRQGRPRRFLPGHQLRVARRQCV